MPKRYKKTFFGGKRRNASSITNIKRMNERNKSQETEVDHAIQEGSMLETNENQLLFETEETAESDDGEFYVEGLDTSSELSEEDAENVIDFHNTDEYCSISESNVYIDDMDTSSELSEQDAWNVCCSDSDSEDEDSCFFRYEDDAEENIDGESESDFDDAVDDVMDEQYKITGKRIVDLEHIFAEIRKINSHSTTCNFNDMRLAKQEVKKGFVSHFRYICRKCYYIHVIKTCKQPRDQFDLNYECVLGSMLIGIGWSQLSEFTGVLGIPAITSKSYRAKEQKIHVDVSAAADASTQLVAEAEIEFAVKTGSTDQDGRPMVTGVVDAAWSKRSYRTNYSALSGSAVIIGHHTQKVLWQGVANKFCSVCKYISTNNLEPYSHDCNINYVGPSTGMEPKLIIDGFKECEREFGIRFNRLIGDGDSSVITELLKANIYQNPNLKTDKIECCNHVERNLRGHLRKFSEKGPLKQYVTTAKIEEIVKAIRCARKHWNSQDLPLESKIENLRKDIYNVPFHVFGCHQKCSDYFCKKKKSDEPNLVTLMKANSTFNSILDAMSRVRSNARSILLNENTNIAEQFNGLIAKYTGGKRVNFSKSKSFTARCKLAVLQHNTGRAYSTLCEHLAKIPNPIATKIEFQRIVKKLWHNNKKRPYQPKPTSKGNDKDYGSLSCAKPDMDDETFEFERQKFLERLATNQAIRNEIERCTTSQHQSHEWKQYRADLLTASNFGRICSSRSPQSYEGIVKSILYTDVSKLKQIAHGTFYEDNAIRKLEELLDISVQRCGLFIDSEISFLGASPDGIVGDNAIVEVKCPHSIFENNIDEAILNGKLNVWSRSKKPRKDNSAYIPTITGINKRHKWYYQVQGQLHITGKDFCYFVVWVGDDYPIKVEIIYRDDDFWRKNMESKLKHFYQTALLPELVDPRMSRTMPLRKFDKIGNAVT